MEFKNSYAEAIFNYGFNLEMEAAEQMGKDMLLAHPTQACTVNQFEKGRAYQEIGLEIEQGIINNEVASAIATNLNLVIDTKKRSPR